MPCDYECLTRQLFGQIYDHLASQAISSSGIICLTLAASLALRTRARENIDQTGQRHQILDPERASAGSQHNERVHVRSIRPRTRQRALHTIPIKEKHPVLAPRPPGNHEHKLTAPPRMKRMRHTNSSLPSSTIKRSRKRTRTA